MATTLKNVNALPVRTWNRLGVNGAALEIEFPDGGKFDAAKPVLPEGVVRAHESVLVCAEFKSAMNEELAVFTRVHANAGVQIRVKKGAKASEPIVARYEFNAENRALMDNNVIFAEANSEVTVVMIYDGTADDERRKSNAGAASEVRAFHSGLTRVIAENCAVVRIIQVQTLGDDAEHYSDFSAVVANGARVELMRIELGAGAVYAGAHMKLEGDKAECATDTFYYGDGTRKLDFNYIANHLGRSSRSDMRAAGALFGSCEKIYRGTIDFVAGASESKGSEDETTLLFSENSKNRSAPLILCGEENVEGSHAASVGKMDEAKLYYLQSRGLSEAEAKRLMVAALMETTMKSLTLEDECNRLREYLEAKI